MYNIFLILREKEIFEITIFNNSMCVCVCFKKEKKESIHECNKGNIQILFKNA